MSSSPGIRKQLRTTEFFGSFPAPVSWFSWRRKNDEAMLGNQSKKERVACFPVIAISHKLHGNDGAADDEISACFVLYIVPCFVGHCCLFCSFSDSASSCHALLRGITLVHSLKAELSLSCLESNKQQSLYFWSQTSVLRSHVDLLIKCSVVAWRSTCM